MQGNNSNILGLSDKIEAFVKTIFLWRFDVSNDSGHEYFSLPNLQSWALPQINPVFVCCFADRIFYHKSANQKKIFFEKFDLFNAY